MKVSVSISEVVLIGDRGNEVDSVQAECHICGHVTESYGTAEASIKRCLVMMKEECPLGEKNFYVRGIR